MVISVGSDHAGYGLKVKMIPYLESLGHTIIDNGNNGAEDVVFFPEVARVKENHNLGILDHYHHR